MPDLDTLCHCCGHNFLKYHAEKHRHHKPLPEEERRRRCRDCKKCRDKDDGDFEAIIKNLDIKEPQPA